MVPGEGESLVYVVDDDAGVRQSLTSLLQSIGMRVEALGQEMRRNLRRKFKAAEKASVIEMTVVDDVAPIVADIYPLYLKVYERSKLKFEKLTERYFCGWVG
jgi:hypothetical protein